MSTLALVVLVGRNKENFIRFVDSLLKQDCRPERLVIVYDVEYTDIRLRQVFPEMAVDFVINEIEYVGKVKQPEMRNVALACIEEEYVWFVDDDIEFESSSCFNVKRLVSQNEISKTKVACIAGRIFDININEMRKTKKPVYLSIHRGATGYYNWEFDDYDVTLFEWIQIGDSSYPVVPFAQGTNMIYERTVLEKIGGFNENLGVGYASYEDSEPSFALHKNGYYTVYAPEIKVTHFKLPRMGGKQRTDNDFEYERSLARNYSISLLMNNYPSVKVKWFFIAFFSLAQPLRILKYRYIDQKVIHISEVFQAFKCISLGIKEGKRLRGNVRGKYVR